MAEELAQISIPNFPSDLKEKLEREAERQDRSLASLLRKVITEYAESITERGKRLPATSLPERA